MKYEQHPVGDDGWTEWIRPVRKGYKMSCCDCDLVHNLDFRVRRGRAEFRASRNNRATAAKRRKPKVESRLHQPQER